MTDIHFEEVMDFRKVVNMINNELRARKIHPIEYLLINGSVAEVMDILENYNDSYSCIKDDRYSNNMKFSDLMYKYCYLVKKRYEAIFIPDNITKEQVYFDKLKEPNNNVPVSSLGMSETEIQQTLSLVRDAIVAYYNVYHNKELIAKIKDGVNTAYFEFYILEKNLLHLLGVTAEQLRNNPDFIRLTGSRYMSSEEILKWIVKDVEGNNDLLDFTTNILHREKYLDFNLTHMQLAPSTTTRILNFHKLRARSQAFMKYGPFEKVSLVVKLNDHYKLTQNSKSNTAMVTKANVFRKYPWAYFGSVQTPAEKYIETLLLDSTKGKKALEKNSKPAIIVGVTGVPDGGGKTFSKEEQLQLFFDAYDEFGDVLDFSYLAEYFKGLDDSLDNDLTL